MACGTLRRCGLVGGSMLLWGWALKSSAQTLPSAEEAFSWLPADASLLLSAFGSRSIEVLSPAAQSQLA